MLANPPVSAGYTARIPRALIPPSSGGPHCGKHMPCLATVPAVLIPSELGGPHCGEDHAVDSKADADDLSRRTSAGLIAATPAGSPAPQSRPLIPSNSGGPHCGQPWRRAAQLRVQLIPSNSGGPHCGFYLLHPVEPRRASLRPADGHERHRDAGSHPVERGGPHCGEISQTWMEQTGSPFRRTAADLITATCSSSTRRWARSHPVVPRRASLWQAVDGVLLGHRVAHPVEPRRPHCGCGNGS